MNKDSIKEKIKNKKITSISPARLIVFSFAALIFSGAFLLNLPIASNDGESIGFLNALFTATSATCVTGLVVADTATQWTLFGQLVILFLIQVGGLGLVTLFTFFTVLMGRKVSLRGRLLAQESVNHYNFTGVLGLIKNIIFITFYVEFIGACILASRFVPQHGVKGFYMGIFHSISAFCNAGFDLMGGYKSLTEYSRDPIVLYTIAGLIVIGGLGFTVWRDLYEHRKLKDTFLNTKLVLISTAFLITFGTVFFLFSEFNNPLTMGPLSLPDKINNAVFHSVTCRTAGYNSLSTDGMSEVSKMVTIFLMYIGAAPGSTGGGIKVTTFSIIIMAIVSHISGANETVVLKRRVPHIIVYKALSIVGLSMLLIFVMTTAIIGIEKINFINVLYEVTSAFGTVGLSTGITPSLHDASKLLLIITMFLGRVGPLSFAVALSLKSKKRNQDIVYTEGKIAVG